MRLHSLVDTFIAYKRSLGMRMNTEARELKLFCKQMGAIDLDQAKPTLVLEFIGDARKPRVFTPSSKAIA